MDKLENSTDLPQLSTYVIYYLNKVLRCEGRVVRSVNFLLTDTVQDVLPFNPQNGHHGTKNCDLHHKALNSRSTYKY